MTKIGFYGLGAFGFAMLKYLDNYKTYELLGYDSNKEILDSVSNKKCHPYFHDCELVSKKVNIVNSSEELIDKSDIIVIAVSSIHITNVINSFKKKKNKIILNLTKGVDEITNETFFEKLTHLIPNNTLKYAVMTGGTNANDVLNKDPLGMNLASNDKETLKKIKAIFSSKKLRIYESSDIKGIELASAYKNIVSLFAGFLNGRKYSLSTITFMITRTAHELKQIATKNGANKETFSIQSQSWGSDLLLSCFGETRNFNFGMLIGQGKNIEKTFINYTKKHLLLEGLLMLKNMSKFEDLSKSPILRTIVNIFLEKKDFGKSLEELFSKNF